MIFYHFCRPAPIQDFQRCHLVITRPYAVFILAHESKLVFLLTSAINVWVYNYIRYISELERSDPGFHRPIQSIPDLFNVPHHVPATHQFVDFFLTSFVIKLPPTD